MQSENQPQGAGSGEPAETAHLWWCSKKIGGLTCGCGAEDARPAPAEGLPVAEQDQSVPPRFTARDFADLEKGRREMDEAMDGVAEILDPAPATGRECWVEFGPTGKPSNQIPLMRPPGPDDVCDGYTWVRMVEPPPSSPAREGGEPSGTASLRGAARLEPGFDFGAHLARQAAFSLKTFGPGARVQGVTDHIRKELAEVVASGGDLKEWIDVVILALDGCWRSGASPAEIIAAMVAKQTKNEGRTWPDWRTADPNKAIEHDRSAE